MGRTLNVTEEGLLMETHIPLEKGQQVIITLGLKDQLIDVLGRIVHTKYTAGRYQNGIAFSRLSETDRSILDAYMAAFHTRYPASGVVFPPPHSPD